LSRTKNIDTKLSPTEVNISKSNLYQKFKETASNAFNNTVEFIQDDMVRVKNLLRKPTLKLSEASNIYEKEILFHGRVASRLEEIKDLVKTIDKDLLNTSKSLRINDDILKKEVNEFLVARHAPERNLNIWDGAAGITTKEANKAIETLKQSDHYEEIVRLSNQISDLNKNTLRVLYDGQVIDKKLYELLTDRYKYHVPLNRIFDDTENITEALSGKGFDVKGTGIKAAKGSTREIDDILTNVVSNYEQAVIRAEKNIIDLSTLKFYRENKEALKGLIEEVKPRAIGKTFEGKILTERITDPTVLTLRENGKPVYLKVNDKHLAAALKGINRQSVDGLMKGVKSVTRLYSSLATRFNPEFAFPNKIRDLQEAMVYMASKNEVGFKGGAKMVTRDAGSSKDVLDYIRGVDSEGADLYRQMKFDGGTTGGLSLSTKKMVELNIEDIKKLNRSKPKQAAEMALEMVDNWNTIFEDSTRLSVYKQALSDGLTRQKAAVMAKEASVNFNKFGTGGPVINALYMFSNASIQGSAKMLNAMKNPRVAGTVVTTMGVSTFAVNQYNDRMDPKWREKVSEWDRMNGMVVMLPAGDDEKVNYFVVPVSWGLKPIKVIMDEMYDTATGNSKDFVDSFSKIVASVVEGYNPIGGSDIVSAVTPSVLDLPVEIARNKAWSGSKIRPDWDQNAPMSTRYFDSLENTASGRMSILATGELSETGIEISPENVDYAYQQLVGGAGRFLSKVINTFSSIGKGEVPEAKEIPFLSRFLRSKSGEEVGAGSEEVEDIKLILGEQSREKFYFNKEAERKYEELKKMDKTDAKTEFDRLITDNPNLAKKINEIIKEESLGLTYVDRQIIQLGVENGERARYIFSKIKELETKEEKKKYYQELIDKRIVSSEVSEQIEYLMNQ
jgi:hypothetical protein